MVLGPVVRLAGVRMMRMGVFCGTLLDRHACGGLEHVMGMRRLTLAENVGRQTADGNHFARQRLLVLNMPDWLRLRFPQLVGSRLASPA